MGPLIGAAIAFGVTALAITGVARWFKVIRFDKLDDAAVTIANIVGHLGNIQLIQLQLPIKDRRTGIEVRPIRLEADFMIIVFWETEKDGLTYSTVISETDDDVVITFCNGRVHEWLRNGKYVPKVVGDTGIDFQAGEILSKIRDRIREWHARSRTQPLP